MTYIAEDSVKRNVAIKKDFTLLGKIAGVDMVAKQARYHESCRREYTRDYKKPHHRDDGDVQDDLFYRSKEQRAACDEAFTYISDYVSNNTILGGSVERMTMLQDKYLQYVQVHTPAFYNPNHKTDKLKEKLCRKFGDKLQFWQPNYRGVILYSSGLAIGDAIGEAFESATSERKILEDAA